MGIKIRNNFKELQKDLAAIVEDTAKVERYVISDLKKKVPGLVSSAVATIYNIKKSEVARANYKTESQWAGSRKVSLRTEGSTIGGLTFHFRGRRHADWKTTARPKPKPINSGKVFSNKKKYTTFQEVFRGQKTPITARGNNRVFIANIGGKLVPMVVGAGTSNKPLVKGSSSVPDAILNEKVKAIWQPELNRYVEDRLIHHTNRHLAGAAYPDFTK